MSPTTEPGAGRPWYAQPDDLIGGWCVTDVDRPPSTFVDPLPGAPPATGRYIAAFTDQAAARRIAALHNADLDRRSAPGDLQPQTSPTAEDVPGRLCAQRLADLVVDLARLALAFGRIDRTAVYHPDGVTPESDTDHTVMLVWVACALAARCYPGLDVGLVAQFAAVHDAPEVYAGDTQTLRIDTAGRAAKADREQAAATRLRREFAAALPWFPDTIDRYEAQREPEARFVRGVDKVLPKAVHLLDGAAGLREFGIGRTELAEVLDRQREDMRRYVGEFTELMALRAELADRVLDETDPWAAAAPIDHATPHHLANRRERYAARRGHRRTWTATADAATAPDSRPGDESLASRRRAGTSTTQPRERGEP